MGRALLTSGCRLVRSHRSPCAIAGFYPHPDPLPAREREEREPHPNPLLARERERSFHRNSCGYALATLLAGFAAGLTALAPDLRHMLAVARHGFAAAAPDRGHMLAIARYLLSPFSAGRRMAFGVSMPATSGNGVCTVVRMLLRLRTLWRYAMMFTLGCHLIYSLQWFKRRNRPDAPAIRRSVR